MPVTIGVGAGLAGLGIAGNLYEGHQNRAAQARLNRAMQENALASKRNAQGLLDKTQFGQLTPDMERRLKALGEESKPVPLAQDPAFQAQRAQLLQGGASELASVQNRQKALGVSRGGFSNTGSLQDVQDRLGLGLAGLAGQAEGLRQQKSQQLADFTQGRQDRQEGIYNQYLQNLSNIEAGGGVAQQQALQSALQSQQQNSAQQQALFGNLTGIGGTLAGQALSAQSQNKAMAQAQMNQDIQNKLLIEALSGRNRGVDYSPTLGNEGIA